METEEGKKVKLEVDKMTVVVMFSVYMYKSSRLRVVNKDFLVYVSYSE